MDEVNTLRMEITEGQQTRANALRCRTAAAFLNAFHKVITPSNLYSAFKTTGFVPFSPTRPLESPLVAAVSTRFFDDTARRTNRVNAELLTDCDSIQRLFADQNGRIMTNQDLL
jgi:hypothetical protein